VRDFEQMGNVGVAGAAELVAVALRSNVVGTPDQPRIIRRTVIPKLYQQLFQAGIHLPLGSVPIEIQR
jgi:hypothetical protein